MYNYFPHPSNARQSSMCVSLLVEEGFAGYGIYWALLELLRDAPDYKYTSDERLLSYALHHPDADQVRRVIRNYGLFDFDDNGLFFSPWLLDQLNSYDDKKAKLQEAGRKGAARRWAASHSNNGQAIATPSGDDGQAIAYNNTQYNVIEKDLTKPSNGNVEGWRDILSVSSPAISEDYVTVLASTQPSGHAPAYVAQVCRAYGMTEAVCNFICEHTNNAETSNSLYVRFCAIVKRIETEKWAPKHPANFFLSKLFD